MVRSTTKAAPFIYLIIPAHVCTWECNDHRALRPTGRLTLHPWPPSAGQTLTLEQMDNGLYALSAPEHTLLLPALATALPFTFCCPPFLFLHLPWPALDCLNSWRYARASLFFCLLCISVILPLHSSFTALMFHHIPCFTFSLFHLPLSLSHPPAGASHMLIWTANTPPG